MRCLSNIIDSVLLRGLFIIVLVVLLIKNSNLINNSETFWMEVKKPLAILPLPREILLPMHLMHIMNILIRTC